MTQALTLKPGWNWVSFNVLPASRKIGDVLGTAGFTTNSIILTNGAISRFTNAGWNPDSFTIDFGKLYQIYVPNAVTATISGEACKTSTVPLATGWSWIGNPTGKAVAPSELTHSGGWTAGDRLQTTGGVLTYTGSMWIPANFTLSPSKGCQIYTANAGTLAFPSSSDNAPLYVVVDLSGGPDAASYPVRYTSTPPNLDDDTCRTTELWLRKIPAGTFIMGSPENEAGRNDNDMVQHQVTITQMFYIGVFECTQKQWELVTGSNPSTYKGDGRPVEQARFNDIRGSSPNAGAGWPAYGHTVDGDSFLGRLQSKTGLTFDLPTEAQWEYACRAGTTTALNSGKNLTNPNGRDSAMDEVGRYRPNAQDGNGGYSQHTKVGSYLPNAWGIYDMHGNVWEFCLDWWGASTSMTEAVVDPSGPTSGDRRVERGGNWYDEPSCACRSATRWWNYVTAGSFGNVGFRVACLP